MVPFFRGFIGYGVPLEDPREQWGTLINNLGGIMYGAGVGTSIRTGSSSALTISLIYRYQSLVSNYEEEWTGQHSRIETRFNRIALRVGFVFD